MDSSSLTEQKHSVNNTQLATKNEIETIIGNIIKKLPKEGEVLNKQIRVHDPKNRGSNYTVSQSDYVWAQYQAIDTIYNDNPIKWPGLIQLLYYISGTNIKLCTGRIAYQHLSTEPPSFSIDMQKNENKQLNKDEIVDMVYIKDPTTGLYAPKFIKFVTDFYDRVINGDCFNSNFNTLFFDLYMDQGGHQNIILAFKTKNSHRVTLAVYEPHGSESSSVIMLSNELLYFIIDVAPDKFKIASRFRVSMPEGLQSYANDNLGYCIAFSLFWLFCVLYISKVTNGRVDLSNIRYVEIYIKKFAKSPEYLMKIVYDFSLFLVNKYITLMSTRSPRFNEVFASNVFYNIRMTTDIKKKRDQSKRELPLDIQKEQEKYLSNVVLSSGKRKIYRKNDGEKCNSNSDCASDICNSNKCVPRERKYK